MTTTSTQTNLCFCPPFTNPRHYHTRHIPRHPLNRLPRLHAAAKRTRSIVMEEIDGGTMPDFNDTLQVQYFNETPSTTPLPSESPSDLDASPTIRELPLFPLQLVLNPGSNIPLHIFELRYRLLFNHIRDGDSRFGIVLYDGTTKSIALVGCTAELTRFEPMPDGRIMVNNIGRERFRILRIIEEKPYTRAVVQFMHDDAPSDNLTSLVGEVWQALQDVLRLSNKLYDKVLDLSPDLKRLAPGVSAGEGEEGLPEGWPSPAKLEQFSFAVCQVLDMPLKEQQIMLQICDTRARLQRQFKMLKTARQYLAAQVTIKDAGLKEP